MLKATTRSKPDLLTYPHLVTYLDSYAIALGAFEHKSKPTVRLVIVSATDQTAIGHIIEVDAGSVVQFDGVLQLENTR